ncbi:MAG: hypothetical protein ABI042_02845 [Verrucomicrobiota bacterium]
MIAYKKNAVVQAGGKLTLSELPFQTTQQVEVILTVAGERASQVEKLKEVLRQTQQLPQAKTISEQEIAEEITAYRAGR